MAEYDADSLRIADARLSQLLTQIETVLAEDFPNKDIETAAQTLREAVIRRIQQVRDAADYASGVVEEILSSVSLQIENFSYLLGMLFRSSATRNPFELYVPFKSLAEQFFPERNVFLVLSSEWEYIPFTHPMNLEDLPRFIVIGMPAAEADNILTFPAAGHELGHSIWLRSDLGTEFANLIKGELEQRIADNPNFWSGVFPNYSEQGDAKDIFNEDLKRNTIAQISLFARKQIEEMFCDYVALHLFGRSYLQGFRYILAGSGEGERDGKYPDIKERAKLLSEYAKKLGLDTGDLDRWFSRQLDSPFAATVNAIRIADGIRVKFLSAARERCEQIMTEAGLTPPRDSKIVDTVKRFRLGIPTEAGASLGELICAAWLCYEEDDVPGEGERQLVSRLSNLVLKSAEAMEFKSRMKLASQIETT